MKTHTLFAVAIMVVIGSFVQARGQVIGQPYRLSDRDVERIIKGIENQSDKFKSSLNSALDKSRFNGTAREDDINAFVKSFYQETKRLRDHFNGHKSTSSDVEAVLQDAARIDGFMRRYPLTPRAQDDWATLRTGLDALAQAYNVGWQWNPIQSGGYVPVGRPMGSSVGSDVSGIPYRVSDKEVDHILKRIEQQSDRFRSALDSALDKSRLDGTRREDDINAFVKDFYSETKRLRDHFEDHKSTDADVQSVLDRAAAIDDFMRRNRLKKNAPNEWSKLKAELDDLARVYDVSWRWR
ncbi:MAG TPA: hypothetical protein VIG25_14465 [Pyrinomonadaceae bacterium]